MSEVEFAGQRYEPVADVVMKDHVHALLTALARYALRLSATATVTNPIVTER